MEEEQNSLEDLKADYTSKYQAWTQADTEQKALTTRDNDLKTVVATINGLKASVVTKALSANVPNDPSATFLLLKATVAEELDKAENLKTVTKAKWQTVWNELDGINPPTSAETTGQSDFKGDKTSRGVLDRLIAVLEYERIEAIKQGGREGRHANNIADALRAAYESRARLTFIRPASSYLRSSYPTAVIAERSRPHLAKRTPTPFAQEHPDIWRKDHALFRQVGYQSGSAFANRPAILAEH